MKDLNIGGFYNGDGKPSVSPHHEEINTLKIDKLSNRVTIISVIIPCIIGAIIIFGYLSMKETVIDVNKEKQNRMLEITKQFEEKANALDVKLAKFQAMLDKTLPEIDKKIKKLDANIAKLASTKADKKAIGKDIARLKSNNAKNKKLIDTIDKTNQNNKLLIKDSIVKFETDLAGIDTKLNADATKIEEYETLVATTSKNLSILEKKYDEFKKDSINKSTFDAQLDKMNQIFTKKLDNLEYKLSKKINPATTTGPEKQIIKKAPETKPVDESIEEEAIEE